MKKATLLVISSVAALYATSVNIPTGWSLIGAVNGISPSQITCANTVWTYNNSGASWNLYVKNPPSTVTNNYGFNPISGISSGEGFWVNNTSGSPCALDFNGTTPVTSVTYDAFGYKFLDRKLDATYTVSNSLGTNGVAFSNTTAPLFTLNAYRNNDSDSKAGLLLMGLSDTNQLSAVDAKLKLVTGATGYNKAQLNVGRFVIAGDSVNIGHTGIALNKNGIFVWFEKRNATTLELVETTLASTNINATNMVGKTVDARVYVNGSTINYQVSGDVNASYSYTPSTFTLESGIRFAEVRARNDDTTLTDGTLHSGDVTTVEFSAMGVLPYLSDINATPVTTLNFSDLSSFIMMDGDGDSYTTITKTGSTFNVIDYDYNGTTWVVEDSFSGTVSGNQVTLPNGGVYEFAIQGTQKINSVGTMSFSDLYMSQATTTVVVAPTAYEYDLWDWENPSYYNGTTQVPITNLSTFLAAFTDPNSGNRFGGDEDSTMFLNAGGTVVRGTWDGVSYYQGGDCGDCRIFTRTTEVLGSWTSDSTKVYVDVPKESLTFEVVPNGLGGYAIREGYKDKVGAVWNEVILSGTQATSQVAQSYLSSQMPQ